MIELANQHAADADLTNVVFCLGRIEDLPVEDASVDLVISNCAISLSPAKDRVAAEAWGGPHSRRTAGHHRPGHPAPPPTIAA